MFVDLIGYEGIYQINSDGVIKSLSRKRGAVTGKERILKEDTNNCGYKRVTLSKNDTRKRIFVHRLVYETFVGPIGQGMQIHHINEDKSDNRLENLMATTPKENSHLSSVKAGYKLRKGDVKRIRKANMSVKQVCDKYGISPRHALRIIKNERWVE